MKGDDMYDVIVVGGSFAGMSAAMQLARARQKVLVIDAGMPRNRFADEAHGFLGQDGRAPAAIMREARRQMLHYPTVEITSGEALAARADTGRRDASVRSTDLERSRRRRSRQCRHVDFCR